MVLFGDALMETIMNFTLKMTAKSKDIDAFINDILRMVEDIRETPGKEFVDKIAADGGSWEYKVTVDRA